jgi:hypothetical protein
MNLLESAIEVFNDITLLIVLATVLELEVFQGVVVFADKTEESGKFYLRSWSLFLWILERPSISCCFFSNCSKITDIGCLFIV